eukprot:jgi/Mesvir1/6951/Mv09101-RA.2
MDVLLKKKLVSPDMSRKGIHILCGQVIALWNLYDTSHWTWTLNVAIPAFMAVSCTVKGAILRDKRDKDVRTMTRTGDPGELLRGPLMFALAYITLGLAAFRTPAAVVAGAALVYGDGFAPVMGKLYGRGHYRALGRSKTLTGSAAFVVATIAGTSLFSAVLGYPNLAAPGEWARVAAATTLSAVAEALSPSDVDNFLVPVAAFGVYKAMS